MESRLDEPLPTPPSYIIQDESQLGHGARIYNIQTAFSPPPLPSLPPPLPPPGFSFAQSSLPEPVPPGTPATPKFVCHESVLCHSPGVTTCPSCQLQVTTRVTYRAGALAWSLCVTLALFGFVLGCCLIPLLVDYFKDAYHTCPRCRRVLHVHKKCC
ncbi:hypothetical protein NL108_011330 [Boleophthalmus pectinirostris]|nr:hypothetical protein NL108_011330 [Boleophthalmus pectinirostris]